MNNFTTHSLDEVGLIPAVISDIAHRSECNTLNEDEMLPLFTAPMNCLIDDSNYEIFNQHKINTVIPRGVDLSIRLQLIHKTFVSMGLDEFERIFLKEESIIPEDQCWHVCVDIAHGHLRRLIDSCAKVKEIWGGKVIIMTGNIANPETYCKYAEAGIDYVRLGIGGGQGCLTSVQTGVHYGQVELLIETASVKEYVKSKIEAGDKTFKSLPGIIADGGFNSYSKIIKALALGADYVMLGKTLTECEEACGETEKYIYKDYDRSIFPYTRTDDGTSLRYVLKREYYGMSTKRAQKESGKSTFKTSEGIETTVIVKYPLKKWVENFTDYLTSAMSYCNCKTLDEFRNYPEWAFLSQTELQNVNK